MIIGLHRVFSIIFVHYAENDGLISRKIYAEIPPKVEYTLTDFGLTLSPIMLSMAEWGKEYRMKKNQKN